MLNDNLYSGISEKFKKYVKDLHDCHSYAVPNKNVFNSFLMQAGCYKSVNRSLQKISPQQQSLI